MPSHSEEPHAAVAEGGGDSETANPMEDTVQLINNTNQQLQLVQSLPREVRGWDIYAGTLESVNVIQVHTLQ